MTLRALSAALLTVGLGITVAACGNDGDSTADSSAPAQEAVASSTSAPASDLPTAEELNKVLAVAVDPSASIEERRATVMGGETIDQELFDKLKASKDESGVQFTVEEPIVPGFNPNSAVAMVTYTRPDRDPGVADGVEFNWDQGTWKLSQNWACTLVSNVVPPAELPAVCEATLGTDAAVPTPQAEDAPASEVSVPAGSAEEAVPVVGEQEEGAAQ